MWREQVRLHVVNPDRRHPQRHREALRAQSRWAEISGQNRTHFCGAYWFYGFHEDGLNSAIRVARSLGVDWKGGN